MKDRPLRTVLQSAVRENRTRIAVYGTGEAAELAYLSVAELGLELVAVFDGADARRFLGQVVRPIEDHRDVAFDLLLIATLDALGIERDRLVTLR